MRLLALSSEYPPYHGGIGTYASEMATAAHELGIDVTMVAPDYGKDLNASDTASSFPIVRYAGGAHTAKDVFAKASLVKRMLAAERYDAVHAMDWPFFLPVARFARSTRSLYTLHGTDVIDMAGWKKRIALTACRTFSGNFEVLANSAFTMELFLNRFPGVDKRQVRFVHLGVSDYWTQDLEKPSNERQSLALPEDKFVIATVARLVPRKNQLGLIRALNSLPPDQRNTICLLIIGPSVDADYAREVADAATESEVNIRLLGTVEKDILRRIYRASNLFCLWGKNLPGGPVEGFGLVFLEAGGQWLPSLASDVGAVKEVVTNDYSGLVVPCEDAAAFARALSELLSSPDLLRRLSLGARQRALDLSWRRCAASTYGVALSAPTPR